MGSWNEVQRLREEAAELGRYSVHIAVVLSVTLSLTAVAIISKQNLTNYLLVDLAAFAIPLPIALYFRRRIVFLGAFVYAAVLVVALVAAILFGI